jgi:hypothetical protein
VNDARVVRRFECLTDLLRDVQRLVDGQRSLGDAIGERGTVNNSSTSALVSPESSRP